MITAKKQKVLNGVANNLFAKTLGYPTALMFSPFKINVNYEMDILKGRIIPHIELSKFEEQTFSKLLKWFNKELVTRKVDRSSIQSCKIHFICKEKKKFLFFFPIREYFFKIYLVSDREQFKKEQTCTWYI